MSYHVEMPMLGFKELPDRILVREDGAYGDHKAHGTPIIDHWYTSEERTCHIKPWKMERDTGFYDCMECECGYVSDVSDWAKWHFCPNCGRRVEQ